MCGQNGPVPQEVHFALEKKVRLCMKCFRFHGVLFVWLLVAISERRGKADQLAKKLVNLWLLFLNDLHAGSEWAINELVPSKAQARVQQGLLERAHLPSLHFDGGVWRGRN